MSSRLNIANLAFSHLAMRTVDQTELDAVLTPAAKAFSAYYRFCRDDLFREFKWPFATGQRALTRINSTWSSSTAYTLNQYVEYNDILYIAIQAGTNKQPDTQTAYWTAVSPIILPWAYLYLYPVSYDIDDLTAWSSLTTYTAGQSVKYNNVAYLSLLGSNLNQNPATASSTYWAAQTNVATIWSVFNSLQTDMDQDYQVYILPGSTDRRVISTGIDEAYMEYTFIVNDTTLWDAKFVMALSYRLAASMCHLVTGDVKKGLDLMNISNAMLHEAKRIAATEKQKKPPRASGYQLAR